VTLLLLLLLWLPRRQQHWLHLFKACACARSVAASALHVRPETLRLSNRVASLEVAKEEFAASWESWKVWAKLEELP
jgi:hypothetical protein